MIRFYVLMFFLIVFSPYQASALNVTPTIILSPGPMQFGPFQPSARYLEKEGLSSPGIKLIYEITNMYSALPFKSDTLMHDFAAGEQFDAVFQSVDDLTPGGYNITFWAEDGAGNDISNPRASQTFGYAYAGVSDVFEDNRLSVKVSSKKSVVSINYSGASEINEIFIVDASGRITDVIKLCCEQGTIEWGKNHSPGVYFAVFKTQTRSVAAKILLVH